MDMAAVIDELTYRLASAKDGREARRLTAVVGHWANEQSARLTARRPLRVDHEQVVAEALARRSSAEPGAGRLDRPAWPAEAPSPSAGPVAPCRPGASRARRE